MHTKMYIIRLAISTIAVKPVLEKDKFWVLKIIEKMQVILPCYVILLSNQIQIKLQSFCIIEDGD